MIVWFAVGYKLSAFEIDSLFYKNLFLSYPKWTRPRMLCLVCLECARRLHVLAESRSLLIRKI